MERCRPTRNGLVPFPNESNTWIYEALFDLERGRTGRIYVTWECLAHSKHPPVIYEGRHSAEPKVTLAVLFNIHASGFKLVQDVDIRG